MVNCTDFLSFYTLHSTLPDIIRLQPNPDIAGIGVLIGFVATAWISYILMIFHFMVTSRESGSLLDSLMYRGAKRILRKAPSPHWAQVMETVVLAMSDQQLVTGLAILTSGFYQLKQKHELSLHGLSFDALSLYHWQIIVNLAWFSSTTHLSSLMCLEQYFQKHRTIWYARLFLMTGLVIMLATAILSTGAYMKPKEGLELPLAAPAVCLFDLGYPSTKPPVIIGAVMLIVGFVVRVIQMFSATRKFSHFFFQTTGKLWRRGLVWSCGKLQVSSRWTQAIFLPGVFINLALLVFVQCLLDFVRSRTFGTMWLLVSLVWGVIRLFSLRSVGTSYGDMQEESTWGFGQLVPVLLLLVPFLLMSEGFSEMAHKGHDLSGAGTSNCSLSLQNEPQWHLQHTLHSTGGSSHIAQNRPDQILIIQPQAIESSNDSMEAKDGATQRASHSLCTHIANLCKEEFRNQPWFQDNLLFIMAMMLAIAAIFLPLAVFEARFAEAIFYPGVFTPIFLISPVIIPLCGIQNMIDSMPLKQRHSLSLVRFAIDPGRPYFALRCVFFLYYGVSTIHFSVSYFTVGFAIMSSNKLASIAFAFSICFLAFCTAFFMGIFSIYRQLFSRKIVEV